LRTSTKTTKKTPEPLKKAY